MSPEDAALEVSSRCLGLRTRRIEREVSALYRAALQPHDLTVAQYSLMTFLVLRPKATLKDISDMLALDHSTVSRNIKLLLKNELVSAESGKGRSVEITCTPLGKKRYARAYEAWEQAQLKAESLLGQHADALINVSSNLR